MQHDCRKLSPIEGFNKAVFDHTETKAGTHVRLHGDIETGTSLFDRALRPVVTRYMNRQYRNSLMTMTELIEVEYAAREPEPVES